LVNKVLVSARKCFINNSSDSNEFQNEEEYYDYGGEQDQGSGGPWIPEQDGKSHRASVDEYIEDSYTRSNFSGTILTH